MVQVVVVDDAVSFGDGIVVSSRIVKGAEKVTVAFVGEGVKRLIAAYAGLERAG